MLYITVTLFWLCLNNLQVLIQHSLKKLKVQCILGYIRLTADIFAISNGYGSTLFPLVMCEYD